jgi:sigma-B regulation protein RsbU (phosphoserine phosphatase)
MRATTSGETMERASHPQFFTGGRGPWQERLAFIVETMREMSSQTSAQAMVQTYGDAVGDMVPSDRFVALSRRDLQRPFVRITRSDLWPHQPNPWKEKDKLPLLAGGLMSELIWGDYPAIIDDLNVAPDDPAAEYFRGMRSLVAVPNYDHGAALNMVVLMREIPGGYNPEQLPEHVWMSNLFGRATHNLVLRDQVTEAYNAVERELEIVADIQRSLLPVKLPDIPGLELAAHYRTSRHAGGDYYDFFPLPGRHGEPAGSAAGRWGILIADVSGHGTPAAVIMAVTHSIAHTHDGPPAPPSELMNFVNRHLAARYTNGTGTFVTAFYGIFDPMQRELTYTCAGHPPPRVRRRNGSVGDCAVDATGLPLGINVDEVYTDAAASFAPGELLVLYTDGITEARSAGLELFGTARLDAALAAAGGTAREAIAKILHEVNGFTGGAPPHDDETLVAARLR